MKKKSCRIKNFDYSQPHIYFVTICTKYREPIFGEIKEKTMFLNEGGQIAQQCWQEISHHFPHVKLDKFVIMPNHVHGIILVKNLNVGAENFLPLHFQRNKYQHVIPKSLSSIVRGYKIGVSKWFHQNTNVHDVWQRSFYECLIIYKPIQLSGN